MAGPQTEQLEPRDRQRSLLWLASEGMSDAQLLQRFVNHRDETAFEALVQRHGSMVMGVCRRQLSDPHSIDDAFQATFLVLVRKAATIAQPDLLGNWLYGVAYRVSIKARVNAARRSAHERQAASMARPDARTETGTDSRELRTILDEEINRLPEKYRTPLVLCYLEGKTNEEAAQVIGCPLGSMSWRLSRGRDMLQKRLRMRHLAFPAALLVPLLTDAAASAAVPLALVSNTVRTAMVASGADTAGTIPAAVAKLAEDTVLAMNAAKVKIAAAIVALASLVFCMSGLTAVTAAWWSNRPPQPAAHCNDLSRAAPRR